MSVAMRPGGFASEIKDSLSSLSGWMAANGLNLLLWTALVLAAYASLVVVRSVARKLAGRPDTFEPHSWREIVARLLMRTRSFFLAAIAVKLVALFASAPAEIDDIVNALLTIAVTIQMAFWVREFVIAIILRRAATEGPDHSTLTSAMGVIRLVVNVVVWAVAFILILDNLGVNVTALVAGLGIGGIAIGLAAQGIFSDLFAALSILFDKPFKRGDAITIDTLTGTVEAIGLKTTRVRALSGELVAISNTKLLENRIHNLALVARRRVQLSFGLIYQTPVETLAGLPAEFERIVVGEGATFDRATLSGFSPSSIDIDLIFHVESAELDEMMRVRHNIMLAILRRFAELDISFAYPTQMGFLAGIDGRAVDPLSAPKELRPAP